MVDGRGSDTCDVRCVHCICVMVFVSGGGRGWRGIYMNVNMCVVVVVVGGWGGGYMVTWSCKVCTSMCNDV